MKKVSLAGLAFVVLFVSMSTVHAQSPRETGRDGRFIAYEKYVSPARQIVQIRVVQSLSFANYRALLKGTGCTS